VARYALHRGYFARHFPLNSRKLSYALPSLFVAGLAAGPLACLAWPALWPLYAGALIVYGAAMLVPSFHSDPAAWALVCAGAVATHLVYGVRFVGGWFSPRMPSRAERFDHPSEAVEASP
jgi:hypothetical protein